MRYLLSLAALTAFATVAFAADDVVSAVHGTVKAVDHASKTVAIKTADGPMLPYTEQKRWAKEARMSLTP